MARPNRLAVCFPTTAPVVDTNLFTTGDALHTADLVFSNVVELPGEGGFVKSVAVYDNSTQGVALELWLFTRALANTAHTVNGAWNLADADLPYLVGIVPVSTYYASSNNKFGQSTTNLDIPFKCEADSTSLYGVLVTRGGPTYNAASDLNVAIAVDRLA